MTSRAAAGSGSLRRAATLLAAGCVAAAAAAVPLRAQGPPLEAGAGAHVQHFSFGDAGESGIRELSLFTVPVAARTQLGDRLTIEVGSHWARGEVRVGDSTSTVSGWTDTNVTASYRFGDRSHTATVSGIASLPTGISSYDVEELDVAGAVSADLLPLRVSNWGTGGGAGVRASTAHSFGAVGTAVSVGYFRSGEFDPVAGRLASYRPGDHLSVRAAFDVAAGAAGKVGVQVSARIHGDDRLGGDNLFRAGDRYEAIGNYSFPVGARSAGFVYGGYHRREEGAHLQGLDPVAPVDLFVTGAGLRLRTGDLLLRPSVDGRLLQRGGADLSDADYLLRAGLRADWTAGDVTLSPLVRAHFGSVTVRRDRQSDFTGLDLGMSLRMGSVRR